MKTKISVIISALASMIFITGCNDAQNKMIAHTSGTAAAVTWRGIDNPSKEQLMYVTDIISNIKNACTNYNENSSFLESLTPMTEQYVVDKVDEESKAIVMLGASFILTSIDILFEMYPKWTNSTERVIMIVNSFCDGAIVGLSYGNSHPVIMASTRQTQVRIKIMATK